jgi:hypothetical protein
VGDIQETVTDDPKAEDIQETVTDDLKAEDIQETETDDSLPGVIQETETDDFSVESETEEFATEVLFSSRNIATMASAATATIPTTATSPAAVAANTKPAPTSAPTPGPKEETHVDAATNVYEKAKSVWSWGKSLPIFSTFMGITEAVVGKAVGVVGTDLKQIDGRIKPKLADLDNGILNPAISALVGILLGAAGKTEDTLKPIIFVMLHPFSLIKNKAESENPELTSNSKPDVSSK